MVPSSATALPQAAETAGWKRRLEQAIFLALLLLAFAAPLSTKAAVLAFRIAAALWTVSFLFGKRRIHPQPLWPLLAFLFACALSSAFSQNPLGSWGRMRSITVLLLAVIIPQTVSSLRQLKLLTAALLSGAIIAAVAAGWLFAFDTGAQLKKLSQPLLDTGMREYDIVVSANGRGIRGPRDWTDLVTHGEPGERLVLTYLDGSPVQRRTAVAERRLLLQAHLDDPALVRTGRVRSEGFFHNTVVYSGMLMLIGALAWGFVLTTSGKEQLLMSATFVALLAGLAITLQRGPIAALLIACSVAAFIAGHRKLLLISVAVAVVSVAVIAMFLPSQRKITWDPIRDDSLRYRLMMWGDAARMVPQHPLLGVGLDSVAGQPARWHMHAYAISPLKSHFHSNFFQYAAEGGLLTLAAWIWLTIAYFRVLLRLARRTAWGPNSSFMRGLTFGIFAALTAFTLTSFVHYNAGDAEVMVIFWLLAGMAAAPAHLTAETAAK